MKYEVNIERLVIDRSLAGSHGGEALQQQASQAVRQRIADAAPRDAAADAGPSLESGIAAALRQALARSGRR